MVYEYQKETIAQIEQVAEKLEAIYDGRRSVKIGTIRDEFLNHDGTRYIKRSGDLILKLNYDYRYSLVETEWSDRFTTAKFSSIDDSAVLRINSDVFLKLNELITLIYDENRKREAFHEELNQKLEKVLKAFDDDE